MQGHSIEQFRIYEAIEAGAIPVIENKDGCVDTLAPWSLWPSAAFASYAI